MTFCNERCTGKCITSRCYCSLPIYLMHHIQLPCCNEALHHVICISKKSKCPNCERKFTQEINTYIQNVKCIISEKLKDLQKKNKKKSY